MRHTSGPAAKPTATGDFLALCAAAVAWGVGAVLGTLIIRDEHLAPAVLAALRCLLAGGGLALILLVTGRMRRQNLGRRADVRVVVTAATIAVFEVGYFSAMSVQSVAISVFVVLATTPVVVTAWTAITTRRLPSLRVLAALALAVGGLAAMSLATPDQVSGVGVAWAVAAGVAFAVQIIVNASPIPGLSPFVLTAMSYLIAGLFVLPFAILAGLVLPATGRDWALLAVLVVVSTIGAFVAYLRGLRTVRPTPAAIIMLAEPVAATVAGALWLAERPGPAVIAGAVAVCAAVVLLAPWPRRDAERDAERELAAGDEAAVGEPAREQVAGPDRSPGSDADTIDAAQNS